MQDYFMHGMGHSVVYYAVSIAALMFWNKIAPRDLAFVSRHLRTLCLSSYPIVTCVS